MLTRFHPLLFLAALFGSTVLAGCSCGPTPCARGRGGVLGAPDSGFFTLDSRPLELRVARPTASNCQPVAEQTASAEVYDPLNRSVKSTLTFAPTGSTDAVLTFQAAIPGWYHAQISFEPNLGIAQQDVFVVHDASDAGQLTLPLSGCNDLQPLGDGGWLCSGDTATVLFRTGDGAALQSLPSTDLAVAGNVVWSFAAVDPLIEVRRYEDLGVGPLALTDQTAERVAGPGAMGELVATPDDLLAVSRGSLVRFARGAAGTLEQTASVALGGASLAMRVQDMLYTSLRSALDGGQARTLVCAYSVVDGGLTPTADGGLAVGSNCLGVAGVSLGTGEGGLWMYDGAGRTLRFVSVEGARLTPGDALILPSGFALPSPQPRSARPPAARMVTQQAAVAWRGFVFSPRNSANGPELQSYGWGPGAAPQLTANLVWTTTSDAGTQVMVR